MAEYIDRDRAVAFVWNYCHKHNEMMAEDDFCSRGERKNGDYHDND